MLEVGVFSGWGSIQKNRIHGQ